jgi:DNA invertase Pin-like site-specific DNA recombinase
MDKVGIYARVSTQDQDAERQLKEIREYVATEHPDAETEEFVDIITGTAQDGGEEYRRMRQAIEDGEIDLVVVHELSRLSRLGGAEIHMFLEHAIEHETSVKDLEVGLSIDVDDSMVDRAVSQMIANIMGDLARIEHKQKLRRIESGIAAAQNAGKWTGRPPRGFRVEDGYLRVDVEEFLRVRAAIERIVGGESATNVSVDVGIPATTLRTLVNDRSDLYLYAETDDDRVDGALEDLRPIDDPDVPDDMESQVREIVREEMENID